MEKPLNIIPIKKKKKKNKKKKGEEKGKFKKIHKGVLITLQKK